MSDEQGPTTSGKRRRRRRGRPAEGGAGERKPAGEGGAKTSGAGGGKRSGRSRGGRARGGAGRSDAKPASEKSTESKRRRRSRRGRSEARSGDDSPGRRDDRSPTGREPQGARSHTPDKSVPASPATATPQPESAPALSTVAERERAPQANERWGDDSDAPTPDVSLAADLPSDPSPGDWDPSSAFLLEPDGGYDGQLSARVANIIAVRFVSAGRLYLYDAGEGHYPRGTRVIVESDRGEREAIVAAASTRQPPSRSLKRIVRRIPDGERSESEEPTTSQYLQHAKETARRLGLAIKVFRATLADDGQKLAVYYSCDDKTDVRSLSRELSKAWPMRVDLRHTGVRDEAKLVGGIGSCGQELCCTTWLPAFVPVSIRHAKDQGLVLNPTKVSGQCGRLKCCLVYEQAHYAELRKGLPKLGKRVITDDGFEGRVVEVDVLHGRIRVAVGRGQSRLYGKGEVKPMFAAQPQGKKTSKKSTRRDDAARDPSLKKEPSNDKT